MVDCRGKNDVVLRMEIKARLWPSLMEAVVEYPSLAEAMDEDNYDLQCYTEESNDSIKLVIFEVPPTLH